MNVVNLPIYFALHKVRNCFLKLFLFLIQSGFV